MSQTKTPTTSSTPAFKVVGDSKLPIIAIDGPAGAGKSTAARWLAYQLGFRLIDTGALYRTLALRAMERGIALSDGPALGALCRSLKLNFGQLDKPTHQTNNSSAPSSDIQVPKLHVYCDEVDVTDSIRTPELGMAASNISKLTEVREALLSVQRDFGDEGGIVMEGRDIGTVIFPRAQIKFYLDASVESRAQRRCDELTNAGVERNLEQVIKETRARDEQDMNRAIAPLKKAADAQLIDSTNRNLEEVVNEMARFVRNYLRD